MRLYCPIIKRCLSLSVIIFIMFMTTVWADSGFTQFKLACDSKEKSILCVKNKDDILLLPLKETLDVIGYEIAEECGRCGYDVIDDKNNGLVYVHWLENKVSFSKDSVEIELDADNERLQGVTYTSVELYKYLGFTVEADSSAKVIKINLIEDAGVKLSSSPQEKDEKDSHIIEESYISDKKAAVYFYSLTCRSCKKTKEFIDTIKNKYPDVLFLEYNISDVNNLRLLEAYGREFGISESDIGIIPALFISKTAFLEEEDIYRELEEKINNYDTEGPTKIISISKTLDQKYHKNKVLEFPAVFLAGLINGINPCSLSMYLFFLSLLLVEGKKVLKMGIAFCTGKFIMFFLLGTLFYKSLDLLGISWVSGTVKIMTLILVIMFAGFNLFDLVAARRKKYNKMKLQLPAVLRGTYSRIIKRMTLYKESKYVMFIMLFLGMLLASGEFLCTGQIYLASIVLLLQGKETEVLPVLYLLIYSFAFVTPLIMLTLLVYKGKKVFRLSEILLERLPAIKMISAILFVVFGIYIVFFF